MAGLALALELLSKSLSPASQPKSLHSFATLPAVSAAAAASSAVTVLPFYPPFASRLFFGDNTAHCERVVDARRWEPDWSPAMTVGSEELEDGERWEPKWHSDSIGTWGYSNKSYHIELKPLFSAFGIRALLGTSLRALLLSFQPVLEAYFQFLKPEEDEELEDDDELPPVPPLEFIAPLKNAGKHIIREVAVNTTRRGLERVVVRYASQRTAWKLLKDLSKSAKRKSERQISGFQLFVGVTKTTFRGYVLGVAANWLVQLVLDVSRCWYNFHYQKHKGSRIKSNSEKEALEIEVRKLGRKITGNTLKYGASLVFASIGAGLGSVLIRPSIGQWLGGAAGEQAGVILMGFWIDHWIVFGT